MTTTMSKASWFYEKNNSSVRASRFLVNFISLTTTAAAKRSLNHSLRWLPRVFTNNASYIEYVTERNLVTLSLRNLFTRFSAKVTHIRRLLWKVSFSELRPLPWQHRILRQAVILSFLIFFS